MDHHLLDCLRCRNRYNTIQIIKSKLCDEIEVSNGVVQMEKLFNIIEECMDSIENRSYVLLQNVHINFVKKGSYDVSYVCVMDKQTLKILKKYQRVCAKKKIYFPFGFGAANDLLKVKIRENTELQNGPSVVNLAFNLWKFGDRQGYTCKLESCNKNYSQPLSQ